MIERGEHVCLAHKASAALRVEGQVGGQQFQRDVPARRESRARYTSPIPPAPSEPTTSNGPILLPDERLTATLSERRVA